MTDNWICVTAFLHRAFAYSPDAVSALDYFDFVGLTDDKTLSLLNKGI